MLNHRFSTNVTIDTIFEWFLLSFLAGSVNAGGLLACGRFVSHVTGFATIAGVDSAHGFIGQSIATLTIPAFFLAGVIVSAYLTEMSGPQNRGTRFAIVMGLAAGCLGLAAFGGIFNLFGTFGAPAVLSSDYILLALLCGACGLQNAAITSVSGATIRTTHLTGLTTDLGIGIVRAEICKLSNGERQIERKANLLRVGTLFSFFLGSTTGAILYLKVGYYGFIFPMIIAVYAAYAAVRDQKRIASESLSTVKESA
jgi:uncharacterized membrane protein YoaK (UPF0700 family)